MAEIDRVRLELGFDGGQAVALKVSQDGWTTLKGLLEQNEERWVSILDLEENEHLVPVHKVVYAKAGVRARAGGIGFREE